MPLNNEDEFVETIKELIRKMLPTQNIFITTVESPPPDISFKYCGNIITKEMIYIYNDLLIDYERKFDITEGIIKKLKTTTNSTKTEETLVNESQGAGSGSTTVPTYHAHDLKKLETTSGDLEFTGTIKTTDTLKKGDLIEVGIVEDRFVIRAKIKDMGAS